jgi:multidrug efflux pump subunit AcrA (membrane-fusion protein)
MLKWITIMLGIAGAAMGIYVVSTQTTIEDEKAPPPAAPPSVNPFGRGIAASGQIEANSRNISLGAPEAGLVSKVFKKVGETVAPGDPLFEIDGRLLKSELTNAQAALEVAKAQVAVAEARLARMKAMPRPEEVPPQEAAVMRAKANLLDQEKQLSDLVDAGRGMAASPTEIDRRKYARDMASAELIQATASLNLLKAGAWDLDKLVSEAELLQARAGVRQAEAAIEAIQFRLERLTVRSPIQGTVLKSNVEPGQFAATGPSALAPMIVGDISVLRVRARVDEEDAPLLRDGAPGAARVRGVSAETIPLTWMWVEPLALPKVDLTGSNIERVDTRVVEVIFKIEGTPKSRLFPGQIVDVYIEAAGATPPLARRGDSPAKN